MSQSSYSPYYNTPIRHEDLPITRKSLRTRVLLVANSSKETKTCSENKENKRLNTHHLLSSTRICEEISNFSDKETNCTSKENIWVESPLKSDITQKEEDISEVFMNSVSSDSCDSMEVSIIHQQKHSTPQVSKYSVRTVSSTPNQDMSSISKLTKNAFTQTNFTLNVRDQGELSGRLKSYCIESSRDDFQCGEMSKEASYFNVTTELTSPLNQMCSSKLSQCDETPVQKKQLVRKLSLRSKTMICSALEKSKNISKNTLTRHKSMEEKRVFSNTFSLMPQQKTPPSYTGKVCHNPFEVDILDRLSNTIFSPDVFDNVISPSQESEELRWTIEDISSINPVPIDENFSIPLDEIDPERESQIQQNIDRYFCETHVVLSPDDLPKSSSILEAVQLTSNTQSGTAASTPRKLYVTKEFKTSCTQTDLSLPVRLSVDLEEVLKTYFKFYEADELNLSQCNLRRKLFFHTEDEPPSPVRFEMKSSPVTKDMWKAESSPLSLTCRHFSPLERKQELSSPEVSPVVDQFFIPKRKINSLMACKKTLHDFFPGDPREVQVDRKKEVVNCSVITCSDTDTSSQPASQDTGYQTEDSNGPHMHFSTPTRAGL